MAHATPDHEAEDAPAPTTHPEQDLDSAAAKSYPQVLVDPIAEEEDDDSERKALWQSAAVIAAVILIGAIFSISSLVGQQLTGSGGETSSATLDQLELDESTAADDNDGEQDTSSDSVDLVESEQRPGTQDADRQGDASEPQRPDQGADSQLANVTADDVDDDVDDSGRQINLSPEFDLATSDSSTDRPADATPVAVTSSQGDDAGAREDLTTEVNSPAQASPAATGQQQVVSLPIGAVVSPSTPTAIAQVDLPKAEEPDADEQANAQIDEQPAVSEPEIVQPAEGLAVAAPPLPDNAPPLPDNVGCQYLGNDFDVQWVFSPLPSLVDTYLVEFGDGSQQDVGRQPGPLTTTDNNLTRIIAVKDSIQSALTVGSCEDYGGVKPVAGAPGLPSGVKCRFHDFFFNANGEYTWSETWTWSAGADTDSFVMRINQDGTFLWVDNGASTSHTTVGVTGPQNTGRQLKGIIAVGPGGETELSTANCGAMDSSGWENP